MTEAATSAAVPIQGRVAQLLNARELVINRGKEHGVLLGMRFAVLADKPLEIVDPDTKAVLGSIDREKVRVEVSEVRDKIAICSTYRTKTIPGDPMYGIRNLNLFGSNRAPQEVPETFEAKDASFPPPLHPDESYVKINDRVVQILTERKPGTK